MKNSHGTFLISQKFKGEFMKKRSQIEEQFKWDLTGYFKNDDEFKKEFDFLSSKTHYLDKYKGKLNNEQTILQCLKESQEMDLRLEVLAVYASLKTREDSANAFYQERATQVGSLLSEFSTQTSFVTVEIKKNPNKLLQKLKDESQFKNYFKSILRNKKHILSEKEERILSMSGDMAGGFSDNFDLFDDADLKFPSVSDSFGKKHKLNHSSYMELMQSQDRTLRKNTLKKFNGQYGKFNNFLGSNYISNIKADVFYARASKYKNCLDKSIYLEEASRSVYNTLIKSVNENLPVFYEYFDVKRISQGLDEFAIYDQYVKEKGIKKKYTFAQAIEIIKNATAPLGKFYSSLIDKAVSERWIDIYPNENKDSGAFSWGAYGKNPVLLTNFIGDSNSMFTLAHELGHSMHSYFSNTNLGPDQAPYTIFVAEVASTVNEMLLLKYLLNNSKNNHEKIYYYDYFLSEFKSTVFRQTMFSEFEQFAHETFENGKPISSQILNEYYLNLNKKYFGKNVKLIPEIKFEWSRIPHFYREFYVYKYAIGMISAIYLVEKIIPNNPQKYINFLKSGSTKPPVELLFDAGVDLNNKETFNFAFNCVKNMIENWKKLLK